MRGIVHGFILIEFSLKDRVEIRVEIKHNIVAIVDNCESNDGIGKIPVCYCGPRALID